MKKVLLLATLCLPGLAMAYWQVAGAPKPVNSGKANKHLANTPAQYRINPRYTLKTYKGKLYYNLQHYLRRLRWHLNWHVSTKIPLLVQAEFTGPNVPVVVNRLLKNYPNLKANYNILHKTVTVTYSNHSIKQAVK